VLHGNLAIAGLLAEAGADPTAVVPTARFIGACLAADTSAANSALASDPGLLARVMQDRTDLVARAAMLGRPDAIRLLVRLGFDLNARRHCTRRTSGNLAMVTLLIELGADPTIVDTEHNSTPKGWADTAATSGSWTTSTGSTARRDPRARDEMRAAVRAGPTPHSGVEPGTPIGGSHPEG